MASKKTFIIASLGIIALVAGCGSDSSNPTTPVVDTAPPALPGNLAVQYQSSQNTAIVSWGANVTDADLAGYLVARGAYGEQPTALTDAPQNTTQFIDNLGATCGRQVTWYIYAVDTSGNSSAAATISMWLPDPDQPRPENWRDQHVF